jgi:hypothetical protein
MPPSPDAFFQTSMKMGDVVECSGFLEVVTDLACSQTAHWIFAFFCSYFTMMDAILFLFFLGGIFIFIVIKIYFPRPQGDALWQATEAPLWRILVICTKFYALM